MQAYFDNSATTKPCPEATAAVNEALTANWGNPSSLHYVGISADRIIADAKEAVAGELHCSPEEIFFTSGGTESNNLAIIGAARQMRRYGNKIVSTSVEHPSVDETLKYLAGEGFEIVRLGVNKDGVIDVNELYEAVDAGTVLITMMLVNNEVGSVMPVQAARKAADRAKSKALIHCDAVQAFGKTDVRPSRLGADIITVSSHKIHGPKGAGALYIKKGVRIKPLIFGGEQENKMRPGTQATPAIAGFGAAVRALPDKDVQAKRTAELKNYMLGLFREAGGIEVNSPENALPYITNISVEGIKSEPMLNFLSSKGVCVSAGSACSGGKKSRVLSAMGLDSYRLESPLRISFSRYTTKEEIDYLAAMIAAGKNEIRRIK